MQTTKKQHYISNDNFCQALIEYKKLCKEAEKEGKPAPQIPNYIGECFLKIAKGLSHNRNFINYTFKDEMISDGVENCLMYFDNFDPEISKNPFAYFTQIIYYAFLRRIQKEKKQLYIKYKATEQFGLLDENELLDSDENIPRPFEMYHNISEFIETFEENKKKKKESKKVKGIENFLDE